ncbi:MAG: OB-fold domain-containing protein [Armatimonadetes bacterium]|nr:OB-fold domain-containing protein [Anaerolineae bacterium]
MPQLVSPATHNQEQFTFSGLGTVYSLTVLQETPENFDEQAPYVLALIKLNEGPLLLAQLTDLDDDLPQIGDQVEMVTRKLTTEGTRGMIVYGYKFRRVLTRS